MGNLLRGNCRVTTCGLDFNFQLFPEKAGEDYAGEGNQIQIQGFMTEIIIMHTAFRSSTEGNYVSSTVVGIEHRIL